jgi:hypothetical protein
MLMQNLTGSMKQALFIPWLIILIGVFSCTRPFVYLISPPFDLKLLHGMDATVVATDGLLLKGFIKTFNDKFETRSNFRSYYIDLFKKQLRTGSVFSRVDADTSSAWNLLKSFAGSKEDFLVIDSLFVKNNSDYLINIHHMEVSNRLQNNMGTDTDGNMVTSRREICVVKARIQIIDRNSRKPILELETTGEKTVSLFNSGATLEKAILNSIDHAIMYLQSGLTKFRQGKKYTLKPGERDGTAKQGSRMSNPLR